MEQIIQSANSHLNCTPMRKPPPWILQLVDPFRTLILSITPNIVVSGGNQESFESPIFYLFRVTTHPVGLHQTHMVRQCLLLDNPSPDKILIESFSIWMTLPTEVRLVPSWLLTSPEIREVLNVPTSAWPYIPTVVRVCGMICTNFAGTAEFIHLWKRGTSLCARYDKTVIRKCDFFSGRNSADGLHLEYE